MQLDPRKRARLDLGDQTTGSRTCIEMTGLVSMTVITTVGINKAILRIEDPPRLDAEGEIKPQMLMLSDTDQIAEGTSP